MDVAHDGRGSLFLAYNLYSVMVGLVSNCLAEIAMHLSEWRNIGLIILYTITINM